METKNDTKEEILCITFSFNNKLFAVGTNKGFKVYTANPLSLEITRNLQGGIGLIEMLEVSNIMLLGGGGSNPCYALNKLIVWDDNTLSEAKELCFEKDIKGAKIFRKFIIVTCENEITIFNSNYEKIIYNKITNDKGIFTVTQDPENPIMVAFPYKNVSDIKIYKLQETNNNNDNLNLSETTLENIHANKIALLSFSYDGKYLATASENGTVIRVFLLDEQTKKVGEFRRGKNAAHIYSITFNKDALVLGTCSDTGTAHIFKIDPKKFCPIDAILKNKTSFFGAVTNLDLTSYLNTQINSYFCSEWSFQKFNMKNNVTTKIGFPENDVVVAVNYNGDYVSGKINFQNNCLFINVETSIFLES